MKVVAQDKEYNCGPYALQMLFAANGIMHPDPDYLEKLSGTTDEDGTSHEGIKRAIEEFGVGYYEYYDSAPGWIDGFLPAIVNLQSEGDGHYVTFIGMTHLGINGGPAYIYYDPADGEIKTMLVTDLDKIWYSTRYGNRWFLSLKRQYS